VRPDPNVLLRVEPCAECGGMMLWTQNAWAHGNHRAAAYKCPNGHVIDPANTRQCPNCGVHDTAQDVEKGAGAFECHRCGNKFTVAT
jgi:DNA-directed RNA polymerase subunit M/transcription elongation factor TFIIS